MVADVPDRVNVNFRLHQGFSDFFFKPGPFFKFFKVLFFIPLFVGLL